MFNNRVTLVFAASGQRMATIRRALPFSVVALVALPYGCWETNTEKVESSTSELAGSVAATFPLDFSKLSVEPESGEARFTGLPVAGQAGQPELPFRVVK